MSEVLNFGLRRRPVAIAVAVVAAVFIGAMVAPAAAETIEVNIAETAVTGEPGSTVSLGAADVAADLQGRSCQVAVSVTNQVSANPGNKLVVTSGDSRIEVPGIEEAANAVTEANGTLTLGPTISVSVALGPTSQVTSLGSSLTVTCSLLPPPPPAGTVVTKPSYTG